MKSILISSLLIILLNLAFLSAESISPKIIGGRDAEITEFPCMVSIRRTEIETLLGESSHICGGVIIGDDTILTAAHCLFDRFGNLLTQPFSFTIVSGVSRIRSEFPYYSSNNSVHLATRIVVHPDYNMDTFQNDIAIMRVKPSFEFSTTTKNIEIDNNQTYPELGQWYVLL